MRSLKRLCYFAAVALLAIGLVAGPGSVQAEAKATLEQGNWDPFNKAQLESLIAKYGKESTTYNAAKKPYAVFDFDNTCVFLDIEEAVLIRQIETLKFNMTPEMLDKVIRMQIGDKNFGESFNNKAGKPVNINSIAPDIVKSYTWIYNNYKGLKGDKSLEEVKTSAEYQDFAAKLRYLYAAIGDTFDVSVSYPWVTYLFTNMTGPAVRELTYDTLMWQEKEPIGKVTWTSPESLPGQAGQISIAWSNGLRTKPEMKDLIAKLEANGIDVYICSASFVDVIKEMASNSKIGYNVSADRVMAMELERDKKDVILNEFRKGYDQTQGPGKTETIKRFLVSKYGYGPLFIAGDSEGDQNMMVDFAPADTKMVLIINRLRKPSTIIGGLSKVAVEQYKKDGATVLLQGRDDNTGLFRPSQAAIPMGSKEEQVLRK